MKGIILAGGSGTRLWPLTCAVSKQLLPVYDKPMIYYPLSTLMEAGIHDILLISTPEDIGSYERLLGDGSQWGISLSYRVQEVPNGLAQAFVIGKEFIGKDEVTLILGDNIFHGDAVIEGLQMPLGRYDARIFSYFVKDPERYGVVEFDLHGRALSIEEKPEYPLSNYAVTGLYVFSNGVVEVAEGLKPSARGEYEITDINRHYLAKKLSVHKLGRGTAWLDTGTHESLVEATNYVKAIEHRQGLKICCPEEIAWRNEWITDEQLEDLAWKHNKTDYGKYLRHILEVKVT